MSRAGFVIAIAGCVAWDAAALAFAHLVCTGAAREALGVVGAFSPCAVWLAYDLGRASR